MTIIDGHGGTSAWRNQWTLDPTVTFLNHGSFGAVPLAIQQEQQQWRERLEHEPVSLLVRELEQHLDAARQALGTLLGCDGEDLALLSNATEGVGTVVRSLRWTADDEVLLLDHGYNACKNAVEVELARFGARTTVVRLPFPLSDPQQVVAAVVAAVSPRTKLAVIDHITSPTALVLPVADIVGQLQVRGIDVLVDGAHAPGMVPLALDMLGAAYYTGNCHKWLCAPKGAAFLHVRRDRQAAIRPLVISHGANATRTGVSRFRLEFDWTGTRDPTPWLCLPASIAWLQQLMRGGLDGLQQHNRALALAARALLCEQLGVQPPAPASMIGAMATLILAGPPAPPDAHGQDTLHARLWQEHRIEVPVMAWQGRRLLRVSAQAYNDIGQYAQLAEALASMLAAPPEPALAK